MLYIVTVDTDVTHHIDCWSEVHLNGYLSITLTRFTTSSFYVKTESSWVIATDLGVLHVREVGTNLVENLDVRGGIGTRR